MKNDDIYDKIGRLANGVLIVVVIVLMLYAWANWRSPIDHGMRIRTCLTSLGTPLPPATHTAAVATMAAIPVCATQFAQDTAEARAANPLWWVFDH